MRKARSKQSKNRKCTVTLQEENSQITPFENKKCTFEVNRHEVTALIAKLSEKVEENPKASKKLEILKSRLEALASETFRAREEYEEDYIKFHMAQKRIIDFPAHFQHEVDSMALSVRQQSQHLQSKLGCPSKL